MSNLSMWNTKAYDPVIELLEKHEIPDVYPPETMTESELLGNGLDEGFLAVRDAITMRSGFAVLTWAWLIPLAQWIDGRRCLEIMGGCGSLSKCLQDLGVKILCTDSFDWYERVNLWFRCPWTHVEKCDAVSAIRKYGLGTDIVLCSWPYTDDTCYRELLTMREVNPDMIMLYIGEPRGKATANNEFFDAAKPVFDESFEAVTSKYVTCCALHDKPMLYR